jgi:signal transduction histidine kinase/ActR/RegA family two-component response regulator
MTARPTEAGARLLEILEVIAALARRDFGRRAAVSDALDELDAIAAGLNMLGEELSATTASKIELEAAYHALKATQAQLIHTGKLAAIGQLASGVAHEINNPAAFVMANEGTMVLRLADLWPLVADRPEARRIVAEIEEMLRDNQEGMQRVCSIVADLRVFSRVDKDELEPVALNQVVMASCNLVQNELRGRAQLIKELGSVPDVMGDRGRLGQVITNLLINAAQSIEPGFEETQWVKVATRSDAGAVILAVEDTGSGIPAELLPRLFEPFFTTKGADRGTGLGLSLSAEIVRRHAGTIEVHSEVGRGSRFEVRLPMASPRPSVREAAVETARPAQRARVLLVDDEPNLLRAFRRILATRHDTVTAEGGGAALRILENDAAFDAVMCDLVMPEIDGRAFYTALRERAPHLAARTIFCSGGAFTPQLQEFASALTTPLLEKPITADALLAAIERVLTERGFGR